MANPLAHVSPLGWLALVVFAIQNGFAVLIMRWSKVMAPVPYSSQVAVLMQEAVVKLPISAFFYALECGGVLPAVRAILEDLRTRPIEWAQLAVPAVLYTVQNTLLYVGYANVEAAVGQVTYQSKILFTALFSMIILGKKLGPMQWLALVVLAFGVIAVQSNESSGGGGGGGGSKKRKRHRDADMGPVQYPALGMGALLGAAVCTAFASVYFERMLKGASKPSLWLRNIQLAVYSSLIAICGVLLSSDKSLHQHGWLAGFGPTVWLSVVWQALGGIIVAVTIKYADNILRGFSQAFALIIGALGSAVLFGFQLTFVFWIGISFVIFAVFLYGSSARSPQELCESLAGSCPGLICARPGGVGISDDASDESTLMGTTAEVVAATEDERISLGPATRE